MSDREESTLLCVRCDDDSLPVEGSVRHHAACGHDVWVSPSSLGLILDEAIDLVVCAECGAGMILDPSTQIAPPTPAQAAELRRELVKRRIVG